MAPALLPEFDAALYHVISHRAARQDIVDDAGAGSLSGDPLKVVNNFHWLCHAYCLMDTIILWLKPKVLSRLKLKALIEDELTKTQRDARILQAVHRYGYSQREIAGFLDLHYATVSELASRLYTRNKT